jgi:predicted LPLAT superfamily acyltransferase
VWSGWLPEQVEFSGMEPLSESVHRQGRGAIVLVAHLGNFELLRALAKLHRGTRLTVLVHTLHSPKFAEFLARLEPEAQVDLLQVSEVNPATAVDLAERVSAGHVIVIAADRIPVNGARAAHAEFLGADALFPIGPHVLASLLGCPVWLMFSLRLRDRYLVAFEPFEERLHLPRCERERLLGDVVARYAARLEHYCRLAPLQWFNFYPFWSRGRAGAE